jgi:hypothetical protein
MDTLRGPIPNNSHSLIGNISHLEVCILRPIIRQYHVQFELGKVTYIYIYPYRDQQATSTSRHLLSPASARYVF